MTQVSGARPSATGMPDSRARRIGLLLLTPALLAWLWSYLLPTVTTVAHSFQNAPFEPARLGDGIRNYNYLLQHASGGIGFGLLLVLVPLIVGLLVAPALAVFAHRAGRIARCVTLGLIAIPLVSYAPVALAVGWQTGRLHQSDLSTSDAARGTLFMVVAWASVGLIVAVGTMLALATLRGRRPKVGLLAVGAVVALGVLAAGLQEFTFSQVLAADVRGDPGGNPMSQIWYAFVAGGYGFSEAWSALLLLILAVFGVAAVGLLLLVRARVEYTPAAYTSPTRRAVPLILTGVLLAALLAVVAYALAPWLEPTSGRVIPAPANNPNSTLLAYAWLPPLPSAAVGVLLALLAGVGIAVFRPLGGKSELLLLVFAPWLFVGTGPLAIADLMRMQSLRNTFLGLIPPTWLSIPALVVFTLLLRGLSGQWRTAGSERRRLGRMVVLPALPMVVGAVLMAWLVGAQQLLWPLTMLSDLHGDAPAGIWAVIDARPATVQGLRWTGGRSSALELVYPLPLLVLFVLVFVALGIWYLERLAIQVGPEPLPAQSNQDSEARPALLEGQPLR